MNPLMATIARRPLTWDCWRETLYLLVSLLTGIFGFTIVLLAFTLAMGFGILVIGLPLSVLFAHLIHGWCRIERAMAGAVLQRPVPAPYARRPGFLAPLRDRQTYLDGLWMFISFPLGLVGFVLAVAAWTVVLGMLSAPIWLWSVHGVIWPGVVFWSIVAPVLSPAAAVVAAWVVRGWALGQASLAAWLLGPRRIEELERRVETLAETRAGAVDAAVSELQRVERDLHDGAQARLVALAMDLGLAEQRLASADPESAAEHVAAARGQARAAMSELRDLVRGIAPSILNDRGLDAALTALVSGRNPPVELRVSVPAGRPVGAPETAAYFVVAEALTNARKHARASRVSVHVWVCDDRLIAEVEDDGVGGADAAAGSGLAGLRKRVAALDGVLLVSSPIGGPTRVRAEIPCGS
jgi:signal transduction histidine kinase